MKKVFRFMIFIGIFVILFSMIYKVFRIAKNPLALYFEEPKNSLDVTYIGSSNAIDYFNTTLAYKEYGFTTGMLASYSQPFPAAENLIKESQKYQNSKLYIVDITKLADDYSKFNELAIRSITYFLKDRKNKIDTINKLLGYTNASEKEYISYRYDFLSFHELWKDPKTIYKNIFNIKEFYKGYRVNKTKKVVVEKYDWPTKMEKLDDENIYALKKLINYVKENNINLLFVVANRTFDDDIKYKLNYGMKIIKENGLNVINFNDLDDFEVDYENDYFDEHHVNARGAIKYTLYLSRYLNEHYDLGYHKDDKNYSSWDIEYENLKKKFHELTGEDFEKLVEEDKKMGY